MRVVKVTVGSRAAWERVPGFVYCGRAFGGFDASPLGNPFSTRRDGSLAQVLDKYRRWLWVMLTRGGVTREEAEVEVALLALSPDSVLGCWCCDKEVAGAGEDRCHCDVIARAAAWFQSTQGARRSPRQAAARA